MRPLTETHPDPKKIIELEPEQLGPHVLASINSSKEPVKRADIAKTLSSHYHESFQHEVAHAVEEALGWLATQCLLGASPYDEDMVFVTRRGQKTVAEFVPSHPADVIP